MAEYDRVDTGTSRPGRVVGTPEMLYSGRV
jgi:hypothetical protein